MLIEPDHARLSIARQCQLLGLARSSYECQPVAVDPAALVMLRRIDKQYLQTPFFGSRQMRNWLRREGDVVTVSAWRAADASVGSSGGGTGA